MNRNRLIVWSGCALMVCELAVVVRAGDPTFSADFATGTVGKAATAIAVGDVDGDGNPDLVVGGPFTEAGSVPARGIARWDGRQWYSFGLGVSGPSPANSIAVGDIDGDGEMEVIVGGAFSTAGGIPARNVAMWRKNAWEALGDGLGDPNLSQHNVKQVVFHNNTLYACGFFTLSGATPVVGVAKWAGGAWVAVDNTLSTAVECIEWYDDGSRDGEKLYAGTSTGPRFARLDATGWTSLSVTGGSSTRVSRMCVYNPIAPLGKPLLFLGGRFTTAGGLARANIAAWDGTAFQDVGGGLGVIASPGVTAMTVAKVGVGNGVGESLVVSGNFTTAGATPVDSCALFSGNSWANIPKNPGGPVNAFASFPIDEDEGKVELIGAGITDAGMARLGAGGWAAVGRGFNGFSAIVNSMEPVHDDPNDPSATSLAIGGFFSAAEPDGTPVGNLVVKKHGLRGESKRAASQSPVMTVASLAIIPNAANPSLDDVLAAGVSTSPCVGGVLWHVDPDGSAICGGPFFGGADPRVAIPLRLGNMAAPRVLVAGNFDDAGGSQFNDFNAYYDPILKTWEVQPPVARPNGPVFAAAVGDIDGDGLSDLFQGGSFSEAVSQNGSQPVGNWYMVMHNGAVIGPGSQAFNGVPRCAKIGGVQGRGAGVPYGLYVGGEFTAADATSLNYIARWDGAEWQPLGAGMNGKVLALEVWDARDGLGPMLYAAGDFTQAGGVACARIARWDGQTWMPVVAGVDNGLNLSGTALRVWDAGDGKGPNLMIGGRFTLAGGLSAGHITRLTGRPNPCPADVDWSGVVDLLDYFQWFNWWDVTDPRADVDGLPGVDLGDFFAFFNHWDLSC